MNGDHHSKCGGCGGESLWVLHNVRHRGVYRRLCTNCILKSHQALFCPFCFQVYDDSLPPHDRLMCLKCPSISHLSCVPCTHPHSPPSFLCPSCSAPNFSFFNLKDDAAKPIDKDSARALVSAAEIAAASMTKAAALARIEAERRVREAVLAKKRAREALERLAFLAAKERDSKRTPYVGVKVSNNNKKRILADGVMGQDQSTDVALQGHMGSKRLYSASPAVNVSANARKLKRQ